MKTIIKTIVSLSVVSSVAFADDQSTIKISGKLERPCGPSTFSSPQFSELGSSVVILQDKSLYLLDISTCKTTQLNLEGLDNIESVIQLSQDQALLISYSQSEIIKVSTNPQLQVLARQKFNGLSKVFVDNGAVYVSVKRFGATGVFGLSTDLKLEHIVPVEGDWEPQAVADGQVIFMNNAASPNSVIVSDAGLGKLTILPLSTVGSGVVLAKDNKVFVRGREDFNSDDKLYMADLKTKVTTPVADLSQISTATKSYWVLDVKFNGKVVVVKAGYSNSITDAQGTVLLFYNRDGKLLNKPQKYKVPINAAIVSFDDKGIDLMSFGKKPTLIRYSLSVN